MVISCIIFNNVFHRSLERFKGKYNWVNYYELPDVQRAVKKKQKVDSEQEQTKKEEPSSLELTEKDFEPTSTEQVEDPDEVRERIASRGKYKPP